MKSLSTSKILDSAVQVYQTLGASFLRLCLVPTLVYVLAGKFLEIFVIDRLMVTNTPSDILAQIGEFSVRIGIGLFVAAPLMLLGYCWILAIVSILISDWILSKTRSDEAVAREAVRSLPRIAITAFICLVIGSIGFIIGLGVLAASALTTDSGGILAAIAVVVIIIGLLWNIYFTCISAISPVIASVENIKPLAAIRRSIKLSRGNKSFKGVFPSNWVFSLLVVYSILVSIFQFVVSFPLDQFQIQQHILNIIPGPISHDLVSNLLGLLPNFATIWIWVPFLATGITLIYIEARVIFEGFDIEVLAQVANREGSEIVYKF